MPCCYARQTVINSANSIKVSTENEKQHGISTLAVAAIRLGALKHKIVLAEKIENER